MQRRDRHRPPELRPSDSMLVFPAHDGGLWSNQDWRNWRQRIFAPAAEAIGLAKETRPYDLRHTAASLLIAAGRNPIHVAKQMGHSPSMYEDAQAIDIKVEIGTARVV
jgi:integrase